MTEQTAMFVQFPHPGVEHVPASETMSWNTGGHRRKFLRGRGRLAGTADPDTEIVFWGEWEPPSSVERRWSPGPGLPRVLHRPHWFRPGPGFPRQNTDPWVFGREMLFSCCRQTKQLGLRKLPVGSVLCFGSTLDHRFVLDTVLVVAAAQPWTAVKAADLGVEDAFLTCTAESIAAVGRDAEREFTLYRGARADEPVHHMYSFVPVMPLTDGEPPRFARPVIELPGLINPASWMAASGANTPLPISQVRHAWERVREQVLAAGLSLAVEIENPDAARAGPHHRGVGGGDLCAAFDPPGRANAGAVPARSLLGPAPARSRSTGSRAPPRGRDRAHGSHRGHDLAGFGVWIRVRSRGLRLRRGRERAAPVRVG